MWSRQQSEEPLGSSVQPAGLELTAAFKSLNQTKAALRHIENRLEAAPGTGVLLDSVMDTKKSLSGATRKVGRREGRRSEHTAASDLATKPRARSRRSPDKSSRSPLRNTTLDSNVRRANCVDFREPLASYREATPPLTPAQLEAYSQQEERPQSTSQDLRLSQLLYHSDTRNQQSHDMDSPASSALDSTVVRYLNDRPALDALQGAAHHARGGATVMAGAETSQSSSPGSASQRLENLRRRQPDDKLEKLKERIRRQREHLEEAAERERLLGYLGGSAEIATAAPAASVRKVAPAPPAPIYKGFNPTETKIRTPDGKVWREAEFQGLSREVYRDLSLQLTAGNPKVKQRPVEKGKEKKPPKPVRKVLKCPDTKQVAPVITTSSWREGQKAGRTGRGPAPRAAQEPKADASGSAARPAAAPPAGADPRTRSRPQSRTSSAERPRSHTQPSDPAHVSAVTMEGEEHVQGLNTDLLPAEIRGMLDDLNLEGGGVGECQGPGTAPPRDAKARRRTRPPSGGAPPRSSRSASPAKARQEPVEVPVKKRHYDAEEVRQYIARQQEERKRKQQEERRMQREEAERKNQRLQELYKKQREGAAKGQPANEGPAQKRLQETYTKLLEQTRRGEEPPQAPPTAGSLQLRPLYQPSGESDKENKRLDRPQSASSSSDLSLSEPQAPLLTRSDLGPERKAWVQPDRLSPAASGAASLAPPAGYLLTHLMGLESRLSGLKMEGKLPGLMGRTSKMNRIEALKATAASLSTHIENEARKLARAGIDYETQASGNDPSSHSPAPLHISRAQWAKPVSPPTQDMVEPADLSQRIQRLLNAGGQCTYDGVLPGVGNLHSFRSIQGPQPAPAPPLEQQGARVTGGKASPHNSSSGSISEGPLLSEGSLSEGDISPSKPTNPGVPQPVALVRAQAFCAEDQHCSPNQISLFQKEAEKYPEFSSVPQVRDSRSPWEELAKGSPHSVINIFTKNLSSYSKVLEEKAEVDSPALGPALSGSPVEAVVSAGSEDVEAYEGDFVTSSSNELSRYSSSRGRSGLSLENSAEDELVRKKSPSDTRAMNLGSRPSPISTPVSSPRSVDSVRKRAGGMSEESLELTLVERHTSAPQRDGVVNGRGRDTGSPLGAPSTHSPLSLGSDGRKSPRSAGRSPSGSPSGSGSHRTSPRNASPAGAEHLRTGSVLPSTNTSSPDRARPVTGSSAFTRPGPTGGTEPKPAGDLLYAPSTLQQRMAAELSYLDAMEESVRQLADVERVRGVSLAQQETVSLAQILKSQQQRHERDLFLLKHKAEQEALETRRQLEETRQRAAQAHVQLQEKMAHSQLESQSGLQDATSRMISQQAEAVRYTADAARHIKEMTELARSQIAGAVNVPAPPITALFDQQRQHHHTFMKHLQSRTETDGKSEGSVRKGEALSSLGSPTESSPSLRPGHSGSTSPRTRFSEHHDSSVPGRKGQSSGSVEEEVHTAVDDSLRSYSVPSLLDEKDNTSVATEYSTKFDESMTEDELEERSFRSLLPSESHRRSTLKGSSREDSEEERAREKSGVPDAAKQLDSQMPFSSGQHSFSRFTMDMVRQHMKEEEVRAQHQSSLLRLREKALKEKTKAELAWLEHQKRHLRDKGEDDKMPPIRKRQRGLLLKLQQEQAEIKRLQEANKAARKERQLLLKQQQEIERMQHTTLKLKERLKSVGETYPQDTSVSEPTEGPALPSPSLTDLDTPSPSPISVSGSETSSIMEKLKKMRSHMDEKHCSPVHYFFSVFSAQHWASLSVCFPHLHPKFQLFIYNQLVRFLTKREQQLMQRRRHAEELLEWKQRLDAEEVEVRRMEKQALAAWDRERPWDKGHRSENSNANLSSSHATPDNSTDGEPENRAEESLVVSVSSQHSVPELSVPEELDSLSTDQPKSRLPSPNKEASQQEETIYTQEFDTSSESKLSPSPKPRVAPPRLPESSSVGSSTSKMQLRSSSRPVEPLSTEPRSASQSEPTSDQSDIESRIYALKEELRKRKSIVYQLKKEQRKRHKERLKAQEASLLKQLESYNDFIEKTKAELSKEPDTTPMTKPQIKTPSSASEKPRLKSPSLQRPGAGKNWKIPTEPDKGEKVLPGSPIDRDDLTPSEHSRYSSLCEEGSSDDDPPTVTPTPVRGSPEHINGLTSLMAPQSLPGHRSEEPQTREVPAILHAGDSGDESAISSQRSEVMEELEFLKSEDSDNDYNLQRSDPAMKPVLELQPMSQEQSSLKDSSSAEKSELGTSLGNNHGLTEAHQYKDFVDASESIKPGGTLVNQSKTFSKESKDSLPSAETGSIKREGSSTGNNIQSSDREVLSKLKDISPAADSYRDDFESSVEFSLPEGRHTSKPAASIVLQTGAKSSSRSLLYSSQEEISEALNEETSSGSGALRSERLLDLQVPSNLHRDHEQSEKDTDEDTGPELQSSLCLSPPVLTVDMMPEFCIGDRVLVSNMQPGTLQFKGPTRFANGFWAGVELDKSEGSNNGTYDGVMYFECKEGHGIFAPPDKISWLPEKFDICVDTTEDEGSLDDQSDNETKKKIATEKQLKQCDTQEKKQDRSDGGNKSGAKEPSAPAEGDGLPPGQELSGNDKVLGSAVHVQLNDFESKTSGKINGDKYPAPNGKGRNIILEFEDVTNGDYSLLISEVGQGDMTEQSLDKSTTPLLDLLAGEKGSLEAQEKASLCDLSSEVQAMEKFDAGKINDEGIVNTFADKFLNGFLQDTVKQFQQIKKARNEKILASNQRRRNEVNEEDRVEGDAFSGYLPFLTSQKDNLPIFLEEGREELSSPELCNRPESPVLGASGQEELAKRLAELELSRELLDVLGDEQDWFDEDFGLSSRKEQQKQSLQLQKDGASNIFSIGGGEQVKAPVRPAPPQQAKPIEEPVMVVSHTASEVEKLVHSATQEIWSGYNLSQGLQTLAGVPTPLPSNDYLGSDAQGEDLETLSKRSYKKAVFDLTWEIIQDIFSEDPNAHQPQWMKPRRINASCFRRVQSPEDISKIQALITTEVLKFYGLQKVQNQKTDWQKMLKFGRKKRDRVDHILVQELHEEESQWVNYDEDELFVKMQLADGIFDTLVKDTVDILTKLQDERTKRLVS